MRKEIRRKLKVRGITATVDRELEGVLSQNVCVRIGAVSLSLYREEARALATALLDCADGSTPSDESLGGES